MGSEAGPAGSQPIGKHDVCLGRVPAPWLPTWKHTYAAEGALWLSGGEATAIAAAEEGRTASRGVTPMSARGTRHRSSGSTASGSCRRRSTGGGALASARGTGELGHIYQVERGGKAPPRGLHPADEVQRRGGAAQPPPLHRRRFLGERGQNAISGYCGYIPGKLPEQVVALPFGRANETALVDGDATNRAGLPYLNKLSSVRLAAHSGIDAVGHFKAEGMPRPTSLSYVIDRRQYMG
eukprot:TRINITY_DN29610_c1_g1_i1.p1 TRINITY_DN29610_c1_g1~~TRINITY_DN29610_c1_g1_i1.p1  ORF type:complete len:252 (-),score=22.75 TRINITY_DN29610_c1_g1_i1:344-1057(-)